MVSCLNEYNGVLYPTLYEQLPQTDVAQNDSKKRNSGGVAISNCLHAFSQPNKALYLSNDPIEGRVMLAMSLGLLTGLIQILFSILHIGVFTKYLSDSIVNGFTIGAAYHVVVSQLYTLLGIKPNDLHTPFIIIGEIIHIFKNITKINIVTFIISIVSVLFLFIIKTFVNERFKAKLPVPVPIELILVSCFLCSVFFFFLKI